MAERRTHTAAWANPTRQGLRFARYCNGHLAGQLGVELFSQLLSKGRLAPASHVYLLCAQSQMVLDALGFAPDGLMPSQWSAASRGLNLPHFAGNMQRGRKLCGSITLSS